MRLCLLATALLALTSPGAQAQESKAGPSANRCSALAAALGVIDTASETQFEETAQGCRITGIFLDFGPYIRYRISEVVITSPDLFAGDFDVEAATDAFELPSGMEVTVTGLTFSPDTGSALNDYIIEAQSEPMDIHLDYSWDKSTGTFSLNDLSIGGFDKSRIILAAKATGFDQTPAGLGAVDDLPGALDELTVTLRNARFFSMLTTPALLGALPAEGDPRARVADYQRTATAFVTGLPAETISEDSKTALVTLINSFPRLTGDYQVHLHAAEAVPFTRLAIEEMTDILGLLSSFRLDVTHQPVD